MRSYECEVRNHCVQIQTLNVLIKSPTCHGKLLDGLWEMRNFDIGSADEAVLQAKRLQSRAKSAQLFQILRRQVFFQIIIRAVHSHVSLYTVTITYALLLQMS